VLHGADAVAAFSVMGFTVSGGKIAEIDALVDPERVAQLELDLRSE
jgi:hypothetical protein